MKCKTCHREAGVRDFCPFHLKACENMVKKYNFWRKTSKTSWKEYLSENKQNSLTGEWAEEVESHLVNNEE